MNFCAMKHKGAALKGIKSIAIAAAFMALPFSAGAQTPQTSLGIGISEPQAVLHVHSNFTMGGAPVNPTPRDSTGSGTRDSINPPDPYPTYYYNSVLVTNAATGADISDGLRLTQVENDVTISQQENGILQLENGNTVLKMTSGGVGIGNTYNGVKFNVEGKSRFTQEVNVLGGLICGAFRVSDGLYCDANGNMEVKHLKVTMNVWPDYVFGGSHQLMPLGELESYINCNKHLPGVPTAEEVEKEGADLGEMNRVLMEKVEELTLYIIDLQKQIDELKNNK